MSRSWMLPVLSLVVVVVALAVIGGAIYTTWQSRRISAAEIMCRAAMKRRGWEDLQRSANILLAIDRDNGLGWLCLAEAAQRRGDFETTAQYLAKLRDDDPKCVPALQELIELQMSKLERPLDAIKTCERILRIDPQHATSHQRLVFIYAMTLQRQKMVEQIRQAAKAKCLSSDMLVYLTNSASVRFSDGAVVNYRWWRASGDVELFEVAFAVQLATTAGANAENLLSETKQRPGAQGPVEACREKYPNNAEILAYFVDKNIDDGNVNQVIQMLEAAPEAAENDSRFWRAKGWIHTQDGNLDEAEKAYLAAIVRNPYDWRTRYELATILRRLGKTGDVDRQTKLSLLGKMLERDLFQLPTASDIPAIIGNRVLEYVELVGDNQIAEAIRQQVRWADGMTVSAAQVSQPPAAPTPATQN